LNEGSPEKIAKSVANWLEHDAYIVPHDNVRTINLLVDFAGLFTEMDRGSQTSRKHSTTSV
jgi:phage head maturation protease